MRVVCKVSRWLAPGVVSLAGGALACIGSIGIIGSMGCIVVKVDTTDSLTDISLSDILTDGFTQTSVPTEPGPTSDPATETDTDTDTDSEPTGPMPVCGDGSVDPGEDCDDGDEDQSDACLSTCEDARCGDGFVRVGVETCDDGNQVGNDGCEADCTLAECGDGQIQGSEQCDDGNASNTDGCLSTCFSNTCGDGFVHQGVEACDDGNTSDADACVGACALAICGDGFVQTGVEQCDDGNTVPGDGCDQCIAGDLPPECQGITVLQEASRNVSTPSEDFECDLDLPDDGQWSRFSGSAGSTMPLAPPEPFSCGAHAPGWLSGTIPALADGIVDRDVCFHWDGNTCNWKVAISVRNCGPFVMFKLKPVPTCALRYCGSAG